MATPEAAETRFPITNMFIKGTDILSCVLFVLFFEWTVYCYLNELVLSLFSLCLSSSLIGFGLSTGVACARIFIACIGVLLAKVFY
jgi:hypothetical protein